MYNYCASIVNANGETKRPLVILAISGALNLLLNIILVAGFGMGVEGVAIGTIAAQYLSAIMIVIYMARLDNCIRFSIKKLCLDVVSIKRMLVIGIPSGVQGVLFSLSNVLIQSSINSFGEWVMAGNSAAANLEGFCYVAMNAVYRAAVTFSGQNMGAKKYKNIKLIAIQTTLCAAVIGIVAAVFILVFRNVLIGLYVSSDNITEAQYLESINAAMKRIFCILPLYFLCGVMESHHYGFWPSFVSETAKEAFEDGEIKYTRVMAALAAVEGVSDFAQLLIGVKDTATGSYTYGTENVTISDYQLPSISEADLILTAGTV